jgi:DNA topoisomerase I
MTAEEMIAGLSKKKISKIINDPEATAKAIELRYVNNTDEGISRKKSGSGYTYTYKNRALKDKDTLHRIRSLVIPPAWQNVWICALKNGHLQATGLDAMNRKQYRYHPLWITLRNQTKFFRMLQFGQVLPAIRLQVEKDLSLPGLPLEKVLSAIIALMERTHIRIGNEQYEKLYGSFGLTTLKDKHVAIKKDDLSFSFKGKKGVYHNINIKHKKLGKIVQQCRDIPGKELFQYITETGERKSIDSGMVNDHIKKLSGGDFSAKDFRTWAGSLHALIAFKEIGFSESVTDTKKKIVEVLDKVAKQLGNTRTVCKKYYVHPAVLNMYENKDLQQYVQELDKIEKDDNKTGLTAAENVLMKILSV